MSYYHENSRCCSISSVLYSQVKWLQWWNQPQRAYWFPLTVFIPILVFLLGEWGCQSRRISSCYQVLYSHDLLVLELLMKRWREFSNWTQFKIEGLEAEHMACSHTSYMNRPYWWLWNLTLATGKQRWNVIKFFSFVPLCWIMINLKTCTVSKVFCCWVYSQTRSSKHEMFNSWNN